MIKITRNKSMETGATWATENGKENGLATKDSVFTSEFDLNSLISAFMLFIYEG